MKAIVKVLLYSSILLLNIKNASAQVFLERQVIGSQSVMSQSSEILFSGTAGQAINGTIDSRDYLLTQGFHQPAISRTINFQIQIQHASCATSTDGSAQILRISGCEAPYTVSWSNGGSEMSQNRLSPGNYSVTVTSQNCIETKEFIISIDPEGDCIIRFFKAFSPNGDGINDSWIIENIFRPEFAKNEVEIFNRWGQLIWSGQDYNNTDVAFAGLSNEGNVLPDGTYFFVANIDDVMHKGYLELTR